MTFPDFPAWRRDNSGTLADYEDERERVEKALATPQRPALREEAERLLDYWERFGNRPEVVEKWAVSDMLGILRYITEEEA